MNIKIIIPLTIIATVLLAGVILVKSAKQTNTIKTTPIPQDSTFHDNSNDSKRVSDLHSIGTALNLYYDGSHYYPKDLKTTFKCQALEKSTSQTDINTKIICNSSDPDTHQPYQYMPLDCDIKDYCKKYLLVTEIKGQLFLKDAAQSQKECNFGSGSQYIYCSK